MSKTRITIRIDDDVLGYFKRQHPEGYQSSINDALRAYVERATIEEAVSDYFAAADLKTLVREVVRAELQESKKIPTARQARGGVKKKD
jgi:hypothetical protein